MLTTNINSEVLSVIRNNIQSIRLRMGVPTQRKFAKIVGFDPSKISKWENHEEQPVLKNAFKLRDKINASGRLPEKITLDDLYEYTPDE